MKLTPKNSPKYSIEDIKRDNALWEKRVIEYAHSISSEELRRHIRERQDVLNDTKSLPTALTERKRIEILTKVLKERK